MKNKFGPLHETYEYAIGHGVNPLDAKTWTDDYRKKLRTLMASMHDIDEEYSKLKESINENIDYLVPKEKTK